MEIVEDLLAIPSDISFATKASGDIPDDNSFVTSESNSFATSKQSKRSKSSIVREDYLFQLVHNNELLTILLSSAKKSSIDEITEPSTTYTSVANTVPIKQTTTPLSSN